MESKSNNPYRKVSERVTPCCNIDACVVQFANYYETETEIPVWIHAMDVSKHSDATGTYYAYNIRATDFNGQLVIDCLHRYSDFESLHRLLRYRYESIVVPPIPEKHSITDYATKQGKAKDDPAILERRKRLLQSFLNRVVRHPVLGRDHAVHQFFLKDAVWIDVVNSEGLPALIKQRKSAIAKALERHTVSHPNQQFLAAEEYTEKFSTEVTKVRTVIDRTISRIKELTGIYSDLGHAFNSCSIAENAQPGAEASAIGNYFEKLGALHDASVAPLKSIGSQIEENFSEPISEYVQFAARILAVLQTRKRKEVELEQTISNIELKKNCLATLERSEAEAQRIASVLKTTTCGSSDTQNSPNAPQSAVSEGDVKATQAFSAESLQASLSQQNELTASSSGGSSNAGGLLASINALIDHDPDTTRRNAICKTRDRIMELENTKLNLITELQDTDQSLQPDLNRFQLEKIRDLRKMMLCSAKAQLDFCQQNKALWNSMKQQWQGLQD